MMLGNWLGIGRRFTPSSWCGRGRSESAGEFRGYLASPEPALAERECANGDDENVLSIAAEGRYGDVLGLIESVKELLNLPRHT